jgi:hypothetical protein
MKRELDPPVLDQIVEQIVRVLDPEKIVLSAALGALAGCILWVVVSGMAWHTPMSRDHFLFTDAAMLVAMGAGLAVGLTLGAARDRRKHQDEF